ncbi:MAG: hypothetical protein ACLRWA_08700 [Lachnospira sp.]
MADNTFDENAGTNRLANVLTDRMKRESESPLYLDFGRNTGKWKPDNKYISGGCS